MAKGKGILKVGRTNKGRIFVEIDHLNGRPPQPLSYVVFPDTTYDGKACEYETDDKGIFLNLTVEGQEVWTPRTTNGAPTVANWHPLYSGWYNVARVKRYHNQVFVWAEEIETSQGREVFPIPDSYFSNLPHVLYHIQGGVASAKRFYYENDSRAFRNDILSVSLEYLSMEEEDVEDYIPPVVSGGDAE